MDTKRELKAKYLELFGLSEDLGEESPLDKDHRLAKKIRDSEQRLQGWKEKRAFVLGETPFRKRLKAVENFLLTQELSPLLKGYQPGYFSKGDKERIRFMSAPEGELRIAFPHEPIFPVFQKAPKNSASILYFVDGPDPSRIYRLEIYEDESYAVSQLVDVEWEILREEETLTDLQRELSDNRIEALMADIPLPSDESQETAPSEIPAEQPPEEKEDDTEKSVQEPGRKPVVASGSKEQGAETTATDGAKELDPAEQPSKKFPSQPDLRWGEVSMSFLSDKVIQVRARQRIREFRYNEIGFEDGRTRKPNQLWFTLRAFALKRGSLSWDDLSRDSQGGVDTSAIVDRVKSDVKRLRKILKAFMGLSEDPFHPYREKKAYMLRFALHADPAKLLDDQKVPSPGEASQSFYDQETSDLKGLESTHEEASEDDEDWQRSAYEDSMNRGR